MKAKSIQQLLEILEAEEATARVVFLRSKIDRFYYVNGDMTAVTSMLVDNGEKSEEFKAAVIAAALMLMEGGKK